MTKEIQKNWNEAKLQTQCVSYARACGLFCAAVVNEELNAAIGVRGDNIRIKLARQGRVGGFPDLTLIHKGQVVFCELKSPKGFLDRVRPVCERAYCSSKLSDNQKKVHAELLAHGFEVQLVACLDTFCAIVERIKGNIA